MNTHSRRSTRRRSTRVIAALTALGALSLAACGDDDEASDATASTDAPAATAGPATTEAPAGTDGAAIDPENAEYCTLAAEMDSQEALPTDEQLEALKDAAPDAIADPVNQAADALIEAEDPMLVFGDPEIGAAFEEIDAFEAEACGLPVDGEEEEGEAQDPSVTVIDPAATRIDVTATDFAFAGTEPTEPGRYSFVMQNDGETLHMMILAKLAEGATLDQALESEGEEGLEVEFASTEALPDAEAVVTADLTPGNWVLLCPIPTPDGTPHFAEGMIWEFTVEA